MGAHESTTSSTTIVATRAKNRDTALHLLQRHRQSANNDERSLVVKSGGGAASSSPSQQPQNHRHRFYYNTYSSGEEEDDEKERYDSSGRRLPRRRQFTATIFLLRPPRDLLLAAATSYHNHHHHRQQQQHYGSIRHFYGTNTVSDVNAAHFGNIAGAAKVACAAIEPPPLKELRGVSELETSPALHTSLGIIATTAAEGTFDPQQQQQASPVTTTTSNSTEGSSSIDLSPKTSKAQRDDECAITEELRFREKTALQQLPSEHVQAAKAVESERNPVIEVQGKLSTHNALNMDGAVAAAESPTLANEVPNREGLEVYNDGACAEVDEYDEEEEEEEEEDCGNEGEHHHRRRRRQYLEQLLKNIIVRTPVVGRRQVPSGNNETGDVREASCQEGGDYRKNSLPPSAYNNSTAPQTPLKQRVTSVLAASPKLIMTSPFRGLRRAASTSASSITTCCALSPPAAKNTSAASVGATILSGAVPSSPLGNTAIHPSAFVSATSSNAFSYPYPRSHTPLMVLPPPLRCGSACGITSSTVGPPFSQHQSTVSSRYSSREFSISSSPKNEDIDNNNNINNETNYDFSDIENNCYNVNSDNNLNGSSGEATISLGPNNGSTADGRAPNDTTTPSTTGYEYCIGGGEKPPQFDDECQPYSFAVRRTRPPLNRAIPPIPESKSNESIISAQSATLLRNINNSSSSNNNDNNNNSPSLPTAPSAVEQHIDDCVVIENLMAQNLASRSGTRVIGVGGDVHAVAASSSSATVPPSSSSRLPKLLPGGRSKRNHPASPIISTTASTIPSSLSSSITAKSPLMSVRHLVKNRLFGRHHDRDADAQLRMSRSMMTMRRDDSASKIPTAAAAAAASKMSKSISLEAESPRRTKHDRKSKQHTATVLTLHHNQQQPPRRLHLYSSQQRPSIELVTPTTSNAVGWYTTDESAIPRRLPSTTLIPTTIGMSSIQTRLPLDDLPPSSAPPPPLPPHRTFVVAEGDAQPPHGCRKSPTIETGEFERKTPPKQVQFDVAESPTRKCSSLGVVVVLPKAVELPLQRLFIERTANAITVDAIASAAGNAIRDIDDSLMSYEPSPAHSLLQQQPQKRISLTPLRLTSGSDLCRIPGGGPFSYSSSSVPPPTLGMRKTPQSFPPMPGSAAAVAAAADVDDWRRAKQPPRSLSIGAPSMRKALRDDVTATHEAEATRKLLKKNDSLPAGGNGRSSLLFSTRSLRLAAASMLAEMSPRLRRHHATTSTTVEEPDATPSVIADATAIGGRDNRSASDRRRNTFRKSASIPEDSQESHLVVTTPTLESEQSAAENEKHKAKKLKTHKTTRSTSALSVSDGSAASKGGFFAAKRMAELRTVKSVQNKNRRAPLAEIESSRVAENSPAVEMPPTNFDGYDGQLQQQHQQQEKQQPKRRFFLTKKIDNNKNGGDDNNNYYNKSSGLDKNNNNSVKMESTTFDGLSSATTTTTRTTTTTTATIYYAPKTTVTTAASPTTTIGAPQPIVAQPDLNNNGVSLTEILFANGRQPPPPPSEPPPPSTSSLFSLITTIISGDSGAVDEISTYRPARDANNNSQSANKLSADAPRSDQSNNNNVPHNDIQLIDDSSTTTSAISSPTVHIDNKTNNNNSRIAQLYHSSIPLRASSTLNTTRNSRSSDAVAHQTAATTMVMSCEEPPLSSPTTTNSGSLQLICEYEDNGPVVEHRMEKMKIRNSTESCAKSFRQQQQKPATPTTTKTPLSATTGTTRLPTTTKTTAASRHHNKAPATTTTTTKTTKAQRSNSSTNSRNGVPTAIADDAKSFDDVDLAMTSAAPFPLLPEMITDFKCQLVNLQDAISRDCEEIDRLKTENETLQAQLVHRNDVINALRAKLAEAGLMQVE